MPDLPEDLDPLLEGSFLEGYRAIAKGVSDRRLEEHFESLGKVGKKAAETIDQAKEFASDKDPDKEKLAAIITGTVLGAMSQMAGVRPPAEEGRGAAQAGLFSESSTPSTSSLPDSTPKGLTHETSPSPAPKKRGPGRPRKNDKG